LRTIHACAHFRLTNGEHCVHSLSLFEWCKITVKHGIAQRAAHTFPARYTVFDATSRYPFVLAVVPRMSHHRRHHLVQSRQRYDLSMRARRQKCRLSAALRRVDGVRRALTAAAIAIVAASTVVA
jgi:hypothetical protein